jgi:hypothetical protein
MIGRTSVGVSYQVSFRSIFRCCLWVTNRLVAEEVPSCWVVIRGHWLLVVVRVGHSHEGYLLYVWAISRYWSLRLFSVRIGNINVRFTDVLVRTGNITYRFTEAICCMYKWYQGTDSLRLFHVWWYQCTDSRSVVSRVNWLYSPTWFTEYCFLFKLVLYICRCLYILETLCAYYMLCFIHLFGHKPNLLPHENHQFESRLSKRYDSVSVWCEPSALHHSSAIACN